MPLDEVHVRMSRKIIENGHEVSPGCTDKAIKTQFMAS